MKIGDKVTTWFSDNSDSLSTVVSIKPYTGRYPEYFNCVLVLTAPRKRSGVQEMAYKQEN